MLANKYLDRKGYVKYPAMVQPKLDGVRFTARKVSSNEVTINTRSNTELLYFDEIRNSIAQLDIDNNVVLDGEFYSKNKMIPFKTLNGYCNRKKLDGKTGYNKIPREHIESIQYYIFDCYFIDQPNKPFKDRYSYIEKLLSSNKNHYVKIVPAIPIDKEEEIELYFNQYISEGYEGLMIRNIDSPYQLNLRSNDLLKYKGNFDEEEFPIVGAKCSKNGKEEGCIIWKLGLRENQIKDEKDLDVTFSCRPSDPLESRRSDWIEYQKNPEKFHGLLYTVTFQEKYDNGIPRFPSGKAIRYDL
jgi:DNA ligase-1